MPGTVELQFGVAIQRIEVAIVRIEVAIKRIRQAILQGHAAR